MSRIPVESETKEECDKRERLEDLRTYRRTIEVLAHGIADLNKRIERLEKLIESK